MQIFFSQIFYVWSVFQKKKCFIFMVYLFCVYLYGSNVC